jgi:phosphoribosyl 1,2-cyclic phosphodiesterase
MSLRFSILASGSTGNATVVGNREVQVLVDAGLSAKKIEQLLMLRDTSCERLGAILITHEHSDHIKGLGALARKYRLPIYANAKTWEALERQIGEIDSEQKKVFVTGSYIDFGSLKAESFPVSHDAAEPVGFCFYDGEAKLSILTDTGYVSSKVKEKVTDSDVLVIEANHDIEMLRVGRYPWNVKQRILSDLGHLSNEAAGEALYGMLSERTRRIYLAHLSRDHNLLDLAKLTVNNVLQEYGISLQDRNIELMNTYFDQPTLWDECRTG